ncbi:Drug/Metabolite Transporter (DMT) Superfamily, partial [Thraustotheca clavata]
MLFTDEITPEMRAFPHYKFMIMGLFDTLYNLLSSFPTPHIGGNLANALNQLNLPFNMILSFIFLSTRYKKPHLLGAVLVLYGAMVCMIPVFQGQVAANMPDPTAGWILLYIVSLLPAAGSNVYKEIGLKDVDLDIWYANAWVSFYQVGWGILTIWTVRFKAFCDPPVEWSDFGNYVTQAHECFLGNPASFGGKTISCDQGVFGTFMLYIFFNCVFNQLMLYIFKEGSSVLFVVSSAICLPLTDILYMVPFLAGPQATQAFTIYDGFALFILIIGMVIYHSEKEIRVNTEDGEPLAKSPMFSSPSIRQAQLMRTRRSYRQVPSYKRRLASPHRSKYGIALISLVLARCVDRVYNTRITYEYEQFLWYYSNIINPCAFLFFAWPVVWYKLRYTKDITPEMKAFPHYKYAIMAFLDMSANLLSTVPTPHIGGNLCNVLSQVNLPFTMILSHLFLQTSYKKAHIMGATMVLYGAFVCMIPIFRGETALNSPDPTFGWIALFIFACIPSAGANVYKEIGLKDVNLDVWYANAWVSTYQLLWGFATMWTIRIQAFSNPTVEWADFPSYIEAAHNCFFGNPVEFNGVESQCGGSIFTIYVQYIIFNIAYNMLMMYIFKAGSSVLFVFSSAVCLPLTDLLYMVPILAGPRASQRFTIFDGFALFIIVMGMLVYHSEKEVRGTGRDRVTKSPMYSSPSVQKLKTNLEHMHQYQKQRAYSSGYERQFANSFLIAMSFWERMLNSKLVLAAAVLVLVRCVDRVYNTRLTYEYTPFLWYFVNIINPVAYMMISWPIVWFKMKYTDDISSTMRSFPHCKFAFMAFLDMLASFLATIPTPHI